MLGYLVGLGITVFIVFIICAIRYEGILEAWFPLFAVPVVISCLIGFSILFAVDNHYDPSIEEQFPKEFAIYSENEAKLLKFENLNDEGMLSESGKDKVMALTEENIELYTDLEYKLHKTDDYKNYLEKEALTINSVFTVVFIITYTLVIIVGEINLRDERKEELRSILFKN